jgi:hypothetical protein
MVDRRSRDGRLNRRRTKNSAVARVAPLRFDWYSSSEEAPTQSGLASPALALFLACLSPAALPATFRSGARAATGSATATRSGAGTTTRTTTARRRCLGTTTWTTAPGRRGFGSTTGSATLGRSRSRPALCPAGARRRYRLYTLRTTTPASTGRPCRLHTLRTTPARSGCRTTLPATSATSRRSRRRAGLRLGCTPLRRGLRSLRPTPTTARSGRGNTGLGLSRPTRRCGGAGSRTGAACARRRCYRRLCACGGAPLGGGPEHRRAGTRRNCRNRRKAGAGAAAGSGGAWERRSCPRQATSGGAVGGR